MFNLHTFILCWRDANGKIHPPLHKFGTPEFEKAFVEFMGKLYAHLGEKFGLPPEKIIIYTGDEPDGDIHDKTSKMYRVNYLAKLVKRAVPKASTTTDPCPRKGINKEFLDSLKITAKNHNIIILVEKAHTPEVLELLKRENVMIWTYAVYSHTVQPETYRKMFYKSFEEGIGSPNAYWSVDCHAGDGFDPYDLPGDYKGGYTKNRAEYGSAYCDYNLGTIITGRRAEAHYQGLLDYKALTACGNLIEKLKKEGKSVDAFTDKLNAIVKRAIAGDCNTMDQCHAEILKLTQELQNID